VKVALVIFSPQVRLIDGIDLIHSFIIRNSKMRINYSLMYGLPAARGKPLLPIATATITMVAI